MQTREVRRMAPERSAVDGIDEVHGGVMEPGPMDSTTAPAEPGEMAFEGRVDDQPAVAANEANIDEIRRQVVYLANIFLPDGLNPFVDVFARVRARREMRELIDDAAIHWNRRTPGQLIEMMFYGDGRTRRKITEIYGKNVEVPVARPSLPADDARRIDSIEGVSPAPDADAAGTLAERHVFEPETRRASNGYILSGYLLLGAYIVIGFATYRLLF